MIKRLFVKVRLKGVTNRFQTLYSKLFIRVEH